MNDDDMREIKLFSGTLRKDIVTMIQKAGSGHPGGSLSAADAVAVLYKRHMHQDPRNPDMEDRDRFVLSKGHCAPLLYAVLAELGYFPRNELADFRKYGSILQGHPDCRKTPGVEISTGSLGQGLSLAGGMALGVRQKGLSSRVYCLMGDGEIEEGQIWEAAMAIPHYKLDNLCAMVDSNRLQIDGSVAEVLGVEPIAEKFKAFGWHTCEIDGHDYNRIDEAFREAEHTKGIPTLIVLNTVKGKGVSYMENQVAYHHAKDLSPELLAQAIAELDAQYGDAK